MEFTEARDIISNIIPECASKEYDGIMVKRLEASNTLDEGRTTNQTHIAISGEQMNMFPYLMADGYFQCDYDDRDERLKKYFIAQISLCIFRENVTDLSSGEPCEIAFDGSGNKRVHASIVRSRRKDQADQVQLSLTTIDDPDFVAFRRLLHTGDYLVLLKHKEKLLYDCFGVKASNETQGEYHLSALNNKFYKLSTNTVVPVDVLVGESQGAIDLDYLLQIEKNEKFAKEAMRILSEKVGFTAEMITKMTDIEWSRKITRRALSLLLEIPVDSTSEDIEKLITDSNGHNRYYPDVYDILGKKYVIINNWFYNGKSGIDNRTPFVEWIKELLADKGVSVLSGIKSRKTGAENILLYGVPGAGKSHEIKTKYCADERYIERVVFHPDYMYSDFVGQILPRVDKDKDGNDKLRYVFTPGPFTKMLKKAVNDPENYYYLIIEELNRGNAPAIFGEIFQLLDRKDEDEFPAEEVGESEYGISNYDVAREVYQDEGHPVRIPSNMYILATMNTADQNVFTLDTAFQRRWNMKQIENRVQSAEHANAIIVGTKVNWGAFATVINDMVIEINVDMASSEDKRLGAYFVKKKELEASRFPEKVLKYLWDDAFKMDKTAIFNDSCKTLEDVVITYETTTSDKLAAVLRLSVYEKMLSKMKKSTEEDNEN